MRFEIAQNFLRRNLDLLGRRLGGNSEGEIMIVMIIIIFIIIIIIIYHYYYSYADDNFDYYEGTIMRVRS